MTQITSVGVQYSQYPGFDAGIESLMAASSDGFTHVVVSLPEFVSEVLDTSELREFDLVTTELNLPVQFGIGCVGPAGDTADVVANLTRRIEAGRTAGADEFFVHTRCERTGLHEEGRSVDLDGQLCIIERNLRSLTPVLLAQGARLNLKTHEDLSSYDVERIVTGLSPECFGVSLDVANLVVRGEDPTRVSERLAGLVRQTHLEDIALYPVADGLRRRLRPIGEGVLDWDAILSSLAEGGVSHFTLEHHRGRFDTPVFDRAWFTTEPHVTGADVGQLCRMAHVTQEQVVAGQIPALGALDAEPDSDRLRQQLLQGKDSLLATLRRITPHQNPLIEEVL